MLSKNFLKTRDANQGINRRAVQDRFRELVGKPRRQ